MKSLGSWRKASEKLEIDDRLGDGIAVIIVERYSRCLRHYGPYMTPNRWFAPTLSKCSSHDHSPGRGSLCHDKTLEVVKPTITGRFGLAALRVRLRPPINTPNCRDLR